MESRRLHFRPSPAAGRDRTAAHPGDPTPLATNRNTSKTIRCQPTPSPANFPAASPALPCCVSRRSARSPCGPYGSDGEVRWRRKGRRDRPQGISECCTPKGQSSTMTACEGSKSPPSDPAPCRFTSRSWKMGRANQLSNEAESWPRAWRSSRREEPLRKSPIPSPGSENYAPNVPCPIGNSGAARQIAQLPIYRDRHLRGSLPVVVME